MIFAAGVMAMLAANSCDEIKGTEQNPSEPYYLTFVNESDALLEFAYDFQGIYELELDTNVPASKLAVTSVGEQQWCSADLSKDGKSIKVLPGNAATEVLEATFVVSCTEAGQDVQPLTFVVRRLYRDFEYSLAVKYGETLLDEEYPMIEVSGSAQSLSFTVETTANVWNLDEFLGSGVGCSRQNLWKKRGNRFNRIVKE